MSEKKPAIGHPTICIYKKFRKKVEYIASIKVEYIASIKVKYIASIKVEYIASIKVEYIASIKVEYIASIFVINAVYFCKCIMWNFY